MNSISEMGIKILFPGGKMQSDSCQFCNCVRWLFYAPWRALIATDIPASGKYVARHHWVRSCWQELGITAVPWLLALIA